MIIEWLEFTVDAESREKFIKYDEMIWTDFLASRAGFLGKEVWIEPNAPEKVILVIRWQTREQWKSIPNKELKAVDRHFSGVMKRFDISFRSTNGKEYQIRKFPGG